MSGAGPKTRPKVPEGKSQFLTTTQKEIVEGASISITKLLDYKEVKMPDMVSVELNEEFINRNDFETTMVKDDDKIEFLYFMGGGIFK